MVIAVYSIEFTHRRLEEVMTRLELESLEPIPHRFDDSGYPFTMEWRPLPGPPALVSTPPGCTWSRSNGRLFLQAPEVNFLDGYAVLVCARSGIYGFRLADADAKPVTPANVVSRFVPRPHGGSPMFDGMRIDLPATPPPALPRPKPAPPPRREPDPVEDREPAPAGFLF